MKENPENKKENPEVEVKEATKDNGDLKAQLDQIKKDYLYLRAEFENFRKNSQKERADLIKFGAEKFILELITVIDVFETALKTPVNEKTFRSFQTGMELTFKEMMACLEKFGVKSENPLGQAFDPSLHEACSKEKTEKVKENHIYKVYKNLYTMHGKLIRPAQVVVAEKPKD